MKKKALFIFLTIVSLIFALGIYVIPSTPRNVDNDMEPKLSVPPAINIISPTTNQLNGSIAPDFIVEITDPSGVNETWYTIDSGSTNITFSVNGTIDQTEWNFRPNGTVTITFYANNTGGEVSSSSVTVHKDVAAPLIILNSPISNQLFGLESPNFDVSITEGNLQWSWYELNNGTHWSSNYTFGGSTGTINQGAWDFFANGTVTINFYANDVFWNFNSTEVTVRKDSYIPSIIINSPIANELFGSIAPIFNVTITALSGINTTWYSINAGANITFSGSIGNLSGPAWDNEGNGTVTIRFYANNTDGNTNWAEVTVRKDINVPIITIDSPTSNELFGATYWELFYGAPTFNINVTDPSGVNTIWYTIDGGVNNYTINVIETFATHVSQTDFFDQTAWSNQGNGTVTIQFYSNDTTGNIGWSEVTVRKDINAPSVVINTPATNDLFGSTAPEFYVTITDPSGLNSSWYTIDAGITNYTIYTNSTYIATGTINAIAWGNEGNGTVTIRFYAKDSAGNINWAEVTVRKDAPQGPSGNNLLFWIFFPMIIGAVSISVAIPIKKHSSKKKRKVKDLFPSGKQKDWDFFGVPQDRELIFISYATKDSDLFQIPKITEILKHYPEIDDVLYWESDMVDDIYGYMDENLKRCKMVLLFCTKNSTYSEAVKMEWRSALKLGKKILPVFIEEEYIPTLLTTKLGIQFNKEDPYGSIEKIYQLILKKLEIPSIREYCKYLVPSVITEEDFEEFVSTTNNKEYFVDSELKANVLADKIIPILRANNFYILGYKPMLKKKKKGQQPIEFDIKVMKCFAEDKNDNQKIGLSITIQKETILSSKIMVKVYGKRDWVLTEISSDLSNKLLDLKSTNLLLKEYSEQLEKALEKIPEGDTFFRKIFGPDYKKLKRLISQYLNHEIEKTFLISEGIQIIGKEFLTKTIKALIFGE